MTDTRPIRVLVVDDHWAVRESIVRLIGANADMAVTGQASHGGEALDLVRKETYDLVLLDISMPIKNGIEVLREIKREIPQLPVVMLSIHPVDAYKSQAMSLGASAYITKERAADDLIPAIRMAIAAS